MPAYAGAAPASLPDDERVRSVRPAAFKALAGRGHSEFSSARQQDAAEFLVHLLELVGPGVGVGGRIGGATEGEVHSVRV